MSMYSDAAFDTALETPVTWRHRRVSDENGAFDAWRLEAERVVTSLALASHQSEGSVYEIGCHGGRLLADLAGRLAVAQRAGRLVGVEPNDGALARAEERLRPWLSEHEITLRATLPDTLPGASAVIINETEARLPEAMRRDAILKAATGLTQRGVLIYVGSLTSDTPALPGALTSFATSAQIRALQGAGLTRIEPLLRWQDFAVIAAFAN
jgi:hypothetical protein